MDERKKLGFFVQITIRNKIYKDRVDADGCVYVADFIKAIRSSPQLPTGDGIITLFQPDGTTEIDPETRIAELKEIPWEPMVLIVEESPLSSPVGSSNTLKCAAPTPNNTPKANPPTISAAVYRDYKQMKAIYSSRAFLTSIAIELARIYEIPYRENKRQNCITIGTIFYHAYNDKTLPPAGENQVSLKDYYTCNEWNALEIMNRVVNPEQYIGLLDGHIKGTKELILPVSVHQFGPTCQIIAAKTNLVGAKTNLIIKGER